MLSKTISEDPTNGREAGVHDSNECNEWPISVNSVTKNILFFP